MANIKSVSMACMPNEPKSVKCKNGTCICLCVNVSVCIYISLCVCVCVCVCMVSFINLVSLACLPNYLKVQNANFFKKFITSRILLIDA